MRINNKIISSALVAAVSLAGTQTASASTLTAHWEFDETSGNPVDSVGSIPLTNDQVDLNVAGRFGSGVSFASNPPTGNKNYNELVTNNPAGRAATQLTDDFSVILWVNGSYSNFTRFIDNSTNDGGIDRGYRLMSNSGGFQFLAKGTSGNTSMIHSRALTADTWTMLSVRFDEDGNTTLNVLVDGDTVNAGFVGTNSESTSTSSPIDYGVGTIETYFGNTFTNGALLDRQYDGLMDDVAFFNGLLTDDEIAIAFNSGVAAIPEPSSLALLGLGGLLMVKRRRRD